MFVAGSYCHGVGLVMFGVARFGMARFGVVENEPLSMTVVVPGVVLPTLAGGWPGCQWL